MAEAHFDREVHTEWLQQSGPDRDMKLLVDFAFVDETGYRWEAPAGSTVNGASIPRFLWVTEGSPYVGDYRRASVVHDVACQRQSESPKAVHRMFFEAMLVDGVPKMKAKKMYTAVRLFGPTWEVGRRRSFTADSLDQREDIGVEFDDLERVLDAVLDE